MKNISTGNSIVIMYKLTLWAKWISCTRTTLKSTEQAFCTTWNLQKTDLWCRTSFLHHLEPPKNRLVVLAVVAVVGVGYRLRLLMLIL